MIHQNNNVNKIQPICVLTRIPISLGEKMFRIISLCLILSLSLFLVSCGGDSDAEEGAREPAVEVAATFITMPADTPIKVTLVDSIDTDIHVTGTIFQAVLTEPIVVNGHTLFSEGAKVKGILNNVVESGHLKTPAELSFSITAIQNGNEDWVAIGTNQIIHSMGSHTNKEVAMIGGGAIAGGIIGKIIDRDGSTEIGTVVGAAAGTGLAYATGKQDIFYGVGTEVTFYSSQTMQIAIK